MQVMSQRKLELGMEFYFLNASSLLTVRLDDVHNTVQCILSAILILFVNIIFKICLCARVLFYQCKKLKIFFYIKGVQQIHLWLVFVSSSHRRVWEFESRVVIGQ